jgi:NDP-sugar pyrophosphorylase family protein
MNILIPMAGRGQRFREVGVDVPKPLIEFNGSTMIEYAINTLNIDGNYIFIVYKYSDENLNIKLKNILNTISEGCRIIEIDYITEGPAASALLAADYIDNDEELIITNCDQIMNWNSGKFLEFVKNSNYDGVVVTYDSNTEKNSYVRMNCDRAIEFAEKKVISNYSLNGIHYWRKGKYFVNSTKEMINKNIRVNNEFYISLTYNQMIESGLIVSNYHIDVSEHHAVGTLMDLKKYLDNENNKV